MDVIASLTPCRRTLRQRWRMHPDCSEFPNRRVQMFGYVFHDTHMAQIMVKRWRSSGSSRRKCVGSPTCGTLMEETVRGRSLGTGKGEMYRTGMSFFVHRTQGLFLSVYVDDIKMAGREQNLGPTWKNLMKLVDLGEPTSFLGHVYLGRTQRECKPNETSIDEYRKIFESRSSAGATEKLPGWEKPSRTNCRVALRHRSCEKSALKDLANWRKEDRAIVQSLNSWLGWSSLREGGTGIGWRIFKKYALELSWNACIGLALGRFDILWSVNKIAGAVTKWTTACDRRLARLVSYIHKSSDYRQCCHVGTLHNNAGWHCFRILILLVTWKTRWNYSKTQTLLESLKTPNQLRAEPYVSSEVEHSFPQVGCTSVSHSSTESEVISLDAGWRIDGIPALDLWDLVTRSITLFYQHTHTHTLPHIKHWETNVAEKSGVQIPKPSWIRWWTQVFSIRSLVVYFFKNEAVIKMILKGRSLAMRHVPRTHRVALDWLFDRINVDPKIQIKHVDTKNQVADMLTTDNFTRIMNFSMFSCSHFLSIKKPNTISKRV